jgi:hypothetical protein
MKNQNTSLDCNKDFVQIKKGNVTINCETQDVGTFLHTLTVGDSITYSRPSGGMEKATKIAKNEFTLEPANVLDLVI